ncbi:MAG: hypothetical protein ACRD6U_10540 [Nitrososphaeraceae archaeon]
MNILERYDNTSVIDENPLSFSINIESLLKTFYDFSKYSSKSIFNNYISQNKSYSSIVDRLL